MQEDARTVLSIQLTPELHAQLNRLRQEHPALSRHAVARAALALGLAEATADRDAIRDHVGTHWAKETPA
jgi:predicted transcriptional regulator